MRVLLLCSVLLFATVALAPAASAAPEAVRCVPAFGGGTVCWIEVAGCGAQVHVDGRGSHPLSASPYCALWP